MRRSRRLRKRCLQNREWLDAEADLVAHWPHNRWAMLHESQGLADGLLEQLLCVRTYALDPVAAPLLILADQVAAAVLRALATGGQP